MHDTVKWETHQLSDGTGVLRQPRDSSLLKTGLTKEPGQEERIAQLISLEIIAVISFSSGSNRIL